MLIESLRSLLETANDEEAELSRRLAITKDAAMKASKVCAQRYVFAIQTVMLTPCSLHVVWMISRHRSIQSRSSQKQHPHMLLVFDRR